MSHFGLELRPDGTRPRRRQAFGCLAVLLALAVLVGGGLAAYSFGLQTLRDRLSPAPDYDGNGSGRVLVEVERGQSASEIATSLVAKDVVKSVRAFADAARDDPKSVGIQVGFYRLRKQMSAEAALALLVDPKNRVRNAVTVPEGLRVDQIVALLAKRTSFSVRQFERVLARPGQLGLPSYARDRPEGYLFPATYELAPDATPRSILTAMVQRYDAAVADLRMDARAKALGYSVHDVMTVASIVQAEGKLPRDFPKIARVIYNRLDKGQPLQLDTTIVYIFRTQGKLTTTDQQRSADSPYNTYKNAGLPPTPIAAPGEQAIRAALRPTPGPWLYFVTTDPSNGAMSFATSYADHLKNVEKFRAYCRTHDC